MKTNSKTRHNKDHDIITAMIKTTLQEKLRITENRGDRTIHFTGSRKTLPVNSSVRQK